MIKDLQLRHSQTTEGIFIDLFDSGQDDFQVEKVYLTTMAPNARKGPIVHKQRVTRLSVVQGCVYVTWPDGRTIIEPGTMIEIPPGIPVEYFNASALEHAILACLANMSYDAEESIKYNGWDDYQQAQT